MHCALSAVSSQPCELQLSTYQVKPPHVTLVAVPLWSAWQSVFAFVPVHVRPVVSFEPLSVIDEYVPVRLARNEFHAVHCAVATTFCVKLCENVTAETHEPLLHVSLFGQALPHEPQLFLSVRTLVHAPLHSSVPTPQHFPPVHHSVD